MAGVLDLQFDLDSIHSRESERRERVGVDVLDNESGSGDKQKQRQESGFGVGVSYTFTHSLEGSHREGGHYKAKVRKKGEKNNQKKDPSAKQQQKEKQKQKQNKRNGQQRQGQGHREREGLGLLLSHHAPESGEEEDAKTSKKGVRRNTISSAETVEEMALEMATQSMGNLDKGLCGDKEAEEEAEEESADERRRRSSRFWIKAENPTGPVEYKLKLVQVTESRFDHLVTQLRYRVNQGEGLGCVYYIGVEDNGFCRGLPSMELQQSVSTLTSMLNDLTHTSNSSSGSGSGSGSSVRTGDIAEQQLKFLFDDRKMNPLHQNQNQTISGALYMMQVKVLEGYEGRYARVEVELIQKQHACSYTELRIAMCGAHNAGKSTLMSVLTHGEDRKPLLCNGQGQARSRVFTHKHEIETGRTSSIAHESLAYGKHGICLNYQTSSACWPMTPLEMSREAGKMIRLFDLSGHERYLKTTCYGLTCLVPDFVMLIVSAQEGVSDMTREHAALAAALGAPIFVVVTKIDLSARNANVNTQHRSEGEKALGEMSISSLESSAEDGADCHGCNLAERKVYQQVREMLGEKTRVVHAKSIEQAREMSKRLGKQQSSAVENAATENHSKAATNGESPSLVPVLGVSCVSGEGVDLLHAFLKKLRPREWRRRSTSASTSASTTWTPDGSNVAISSGTQNNNNNNNNNNNSGNNNGFNSGLLHFQVHKSFEVPRVGHVLFGTMLSGKVKVGYQLLLGPLEDGSFSPVRVKSIQRSQVPVNKLTAGQTGTLALDFNDAATTTDGDGDGGGGECPVSGLSKDATTFGAQNNGKSVSTSGGPGKEQKQGESSCGVCESSEAATLKNKSIGIKIPNRKLHRSPSNGSDIACSSPNSPTLLGSSPLHNRKGTVLVDTLLNPCSELSFRAVVKMVKGEEATLTGSAMLVHCGSIRQAANIVACQNFPNFSSSSSSQDLQQQLDHEAEEEGDVPSVRSSPVEVDAQALQSFEENFFGVNQEEMHFCSSPLLMDFKFFHWGEWMKKGSKLVLRNLQTGRLGGVGFVY